MMFGNENVNLLYTFVCSMKFKHIQCVRGAFFLSLLLMFNQFYVMIFRIYYLLFVHVCRTIETSVFHLIFFTFLRLMFFFVFLCVHLSLILFLLIFSMFFRLFVYTFYGETIFLSVVEVFNFNCYPFFTDFL